ncbi:MAG: GIY-YIG nuclease family protein [FCB group bacterium]|nr:GIY-YIG nuclease family protein [FCB group bacterium]
MYYVYILYSRKTNRYYTGSSGDPERRLEEHNRGPLHLFWGDIIILLFRLTIHIPL